MKVLLLMLLLLILTVVFTSKACADGYEWDGFFLGTLGVHTANGMAFGGLQAFIGAAKTNLGYGIMGSYEVGGTTVEGYDIRLQIANAYFSVTYKMGRATIMASQGVSTVIASAEGEREDRSLSTTAITFLYQPDPRFHFMGQARLQGQGLMLTAGVGF